MRVSHRGLKLVERPRKPSVSMEMTFELRSKRWRRWTKIFQTEGTVTVKVLRQGGAKHIWEPQVPCGTGSVSRSMVSDFVTPWTVAQQAPLSMGFSRQENWNGLPCSTPRGSFWSRDQTQVSWITGRFITIWATGEAHVAMEPVFFIIIFPRSNRVSGTS